MANAIRVLSHTEVSSALDCEARWDFSYGGHLLDGDTLRPKVVAPTLSAGRAWGRAVAAWHTTNDLSDWRVAMEALSDSLDEDADQLKEHGAYDEQAHADLYNFMAEVLHHYTETTERLPGFTGLEREYDAPIPSRSGVRGSNRYRFLAKVDGLSMDLLVEFKLRERLTPLWLLQSSRQLRWYAWTYWQATGTPVGGVVIEERLKAAPKPARILVNGQPSHAKDQLCTAEAYHELCDHLVVPMVPETHEALLQRRWGQRHTIYFRPGELEEAGRELTSAGQLIAQLDAGQRYPLRNTSPKTCPGCRFKEICNEPDDHFLVDALFTRTQPKRLRESLV